MNNNHENKNSSLASRSLKYKLKIAFYLMSVLPLLVSFYLVSNYILPKVRFKLDIVASILISVFIAIIGFWVIKEVFDRIYSVSSVAKMIAAGDINQHVEVERADEVGDLGEALNQLTRRVRDNMDELKTYSEKTTQINLEIQKRVFVLSSLLQISSLISQGAKLDEIFKVTIEKSRLIANSGLSYLILKDESGAKFHVAAADGVNAANLSKINIEPKDELFGFLAKMIKPMIIDRENKLVKRMQEDFDNKFSLKNSLAMPVFLKGKTIGALGIGNTEEDFLYKKDDIELLDIMARQVAISIENDLLIHRVEKLEIKDTLTGLYNESFINTRLQEEIERAIKYQRPCAFILLNIDNFQKFHEAFGLLSSELVLKKVASLIKDSISDIDRAARLGYNEFAVVLPEKNKRQACNIAEQIRKKIEFVFSEESDINKRITISGSVSENPLDGIKAEELILKAKELLSLAKSKGKNQVIC
jgi:diguanylate cyclase (GGDEF)-like protein